jgi:hypothetical protein
MTNKRAGHNAVKGKQGFQETEKTEAGSATLGSPAVGSDARQAAASALEELHAQWPEQKVAKHWVGREDPAATVLGNVASLDYLEDGTGAATHTLAKRLDRAAEETPDEATAAVYTESAEVLRRHLSDSGIQDTSGPLDKYDGYRATKIQEWDGRDGMGFNMTLTRDGKKVGDITNEGSGGSDSSHFVNRDESYAFHQRVQLLTAETFEPDNQVSIALRTAAEMSRKRSVPVVFDGDDFYKGGSYRNAPVPKGWTRDEYIKALGKHEGNRAKGIKIWDKDAADFIAPK